MKNAWMCVVATGLAGCLSLPSVGPDYQELSFDPFECPLPDAGLPTAEPLTNGLYRAATNDVRTLVTTNELADWWTRFNDPVLTDLVESARTNNLSFKMAAWKLSQSEYELLGSRAAFLPTFDIGAAWNKNRYEERASTAGVATRYQAQQAALDGNWEIDLFGGNRRQYEAALAKAEAAGWTVADAWVSLTAQIGSTYVSLRTIQARIDVARTNLALQNETYEILKSRLDSGIGDELAVNQCAYVVEETRANIPTLLAQEEELKNALAILAGKRPGDLADALAPLDTPRDWLLDPHRIAELPLDWMRQRPDVMVAERELAAATASIGVAKAQWFPKLYVTGQVGFQNTDGARLFDKASFFAILGPAVSWPIFQGGAIYANVKVAEAKMEQAALNYELALETAYAEVRNAYAAYTQEYHRNQSLATAVRAATEAVEISKDLYRNGLKDFNNVLDAQRSRLSLEESFVVSRGNITLNLIALYRSLGAGRPSGEGAR